MKTLIATYALLVSAATLPAQTLGIGAGLALPNAEISEIPSEVWSDGWSAVSQRAEDGYYIEARGRFGGDLALTAAVSYNSFREAVSTYRDGDGRTVELVTSQIVVPLSGGIEKRFGEGVLAPYASVEGTFSYFYRSFETPSGGTSIPFRYESAGDTRLGAALGAGLSLNATLFRVDFGARLQLVNLVGAEPDEDAVYFFQLGTNLYFGL